MYSYRTDGNLLRAQVNAPKNIGRALFAIVIFWVLVYLLVPRGGSAIVTLITTYISALLAISFLFFHLRRTGVISAHLALVGVIIFSIKVFIGIAHYLLFMDSEYFSSNSPVFAYLNDFEWLNLMMLRISEHWIDFGFGTFPLDFVVQEQKNVLLLPYFSLLYYLGGNEHFLNVTVVNSFHNILVAAVVANFAASIAPKKVVAATFLICLMQPFGLLSSIMWRDSAGQFFLVVGAILIAQSKGGLLEIGKLMLAVILMGLLRNIYILVGVVSVAIKQMQTLFGNRAGSRYQVALIACFVLGVLYYIFPIVISYYTYTLSGEGGFTLSYTLSIGPLVKKFLIGLIGPFPWTQIFDSDTQGREFLLQDILQAVFNLTVLSLFFWGLINKKIRLNGQPNLTIIALVFMIMGLGLLSYGHIPYVTVATVLLLPLIPGLTIFRFFRLYFIIITLNITLGAFWWLIF